MNPLRALLRLPTVNGLPFTHMITDASGLGEVYQQINTHGTLEARLSPYALENGDIVRVIDRAYIVGFFTPRECANPGIVCWPAYTNISRRAVFFQYFPDDTLRTFFVLEDDFDNSTMPL